MIIIDSTTALPSVKGRVHPKTGDEGQEGAQRYNYSFFNRAGVGSSLHTPDALPPVKTRYPLQRRLGGPQGQFGRVWKISPPPGFHPRTVHPAASRCTD